MWRSGRPELRRDIQGLRAIAVLTVLLWHAGVSFLPGGFVGVDVFFVISGFLMTRLLLRELESTGRIAPIAFYARRARRLLPPAVTSLVGIVVLTVLFLPDLRWRSIAGDVISSALYVVNWRLADQAVDYLAAGTATSPVQHFWSLAVEEQYYLVWPLLLGALGWVIARRKGLRPRAAVGIVLGALVVSSYAWSIAYSAAEPARAYFVTTTRLWELSLGGLVAVAESRLSARPMPQRLANTGAAAGLALIAGSVIWIDESVAFPGWVAMIPVLGTALVIACGPACGGTLSPVPILAVAPMQWVGLISYALYLWHWPLLVVAAAQTDSGELSTAAGLVVVTYSFLPAWLSWRLVEQPVRDRAPRQRFVSTSLRLGAVCTVLALVAGAALINYTDRRIEQQARAAGGALGAQEIGTEPLPDHTPVDDAEFLTPPPAAVGTDLFQPYYDECLPVGDVPEPCVFGDVDGSERVAVTGDSHAVMWLPALDEIARARGWRLEVFARPSCPLADTTVIVDRRPFEECTAWNQAVTAELEANPRDLVITTQVNVYYLPGDDGRLDQPTARAAFAAALARTWQRLEAAGNQVVTIVDGPRFKTNPAECVSANRRSLLRCAGDRAAVLTANNESQYRAIEQSPTVDVIDLSAFLCPGTTCPAVIGNVIVYADGHHISATYARSLRPHLETALDEILDGLEPAA